MHAQADSITNLQWSIGQCAYCSASSAPLGCQRDGSCVCGRGWVGDDCALACQGGASNPCRQYMRFIFVNLSAVHELMTDEHNPVGTDCVKRMDHAIVKADGLGRFLFDC